MIAETCSCGANIRVEHAQDGQRELVLDWRANHRHPEGAAPHGRRAMDASTAIGPKPLDSTTGADRG